MIRRLASRFGASYLWGLINFAAGVACGAFLGGFAKGISVARIFHHF